MNNERLLEIIGDIEDEYILEAAPRKKSNKALWIRLAAVAACFCLILSVGVPNIISYITEKPSGIIDDPIVAFPMLDYDNAYYEVINKDSEEVLGLRGIDTAVNKKIAGKHLAYLKREDPSREDSGYLPSTDKTDIELLEYKPANQKAIRVVRDNNKYYIALFDNLHTPNNESEPFDKLLEIYGISSADDIRSISNVNISDMSKVFGSKIEASQQISELYNELVSMKAYSLDEFNDMQFSGIDEGEVEKYYTDYADNRRDIMLETKQGIKFVINYYPDYGWIEGGATLSYYRVPENLKALIEEGFDGLK